MDFNYYISQSGVSNPSIIYSLPTSSCKFEIQKEDEESFTTLYNTPILDKGIGNGELCFRWLFQNNTDSQYSDLMFGDKHVEIKSYPNHNTKIPLGKYKENVHSRYLINSLFSYYNQTQLYPNYFSEVSFNIEHIKQSYETLLNIKQNQLDNLLPDSLLKVDELINLSTGSFSPELAINLIKQLTSTKLNVKPGESNFIVNIKPKNPLDIWVYKVELDKIQDLTFEQWKDIFEVQSSEIRLKFNIFN